jgi:hypothetical protein
MKDLAAQIQEAVRLLSDIHARLEAKSAEAIHDQELAHALEFDLLDEFKRKLDHARHIIWPYLIALQQHSPENVDYALQLYRMQRVREMLKAMKADEAAVQKDPRLMLFLNELNRMIGKSSRQPD